jgi:hypothetical protein
VHWTFFGRGFVLYQRLLSVKMGKGSSVKDRSEEEVS